MEGLIDGLEWFFDLPDIVRQVIWGSMLLAATYFIMLPPPDGARKSGFFTRNRVEFSFIAGCFALLALHEFGDEGLFSFVLAGLVIGFILLTLYRHGKEHVPVRYLCYAIFLIEVFYLYAETISSMVSTSGFLMLLAIFLVVVASFVYRMEKRFASTKNKDEAAAS